MKDEVQFEEFQATPERFVYHKGCDKWWPKIRDSHLVIAHDELFQMKGIAGGEVTDAFEVMQVVNETIWNPPMAVAEQKGSVNPQPFLYIATGNAMALLDESVLDLSAVARRLLPIRVTNVGTLAKDLGSKFDPSIYRLQLGRWVGNNTCFDQAHDITINELMVLIGNHYARTQRFVQSSTAVYGDLLEEIS